MVESSVHASDFVRQGSSDDLEDSNFQDEMHENDELSQGSADHEIHEDEIRRVLFLGALGAGKSTILNVLNSRALKGDVKEFVASSQLTGCTQSFDSDTSPFETGYQIQLIDSPGLADPNIPFPMWINLYNQTIVQQQWHIDLAVCVIEFQERPSVKEQQVFALLNNSLSEIDPENIMIVFNKAPKDTTPGEALNFYNKCCENLKADVLKLPSLTERNFMVLEQRLPRIKNSLTGAKLKQAQSALIESLVEDVWPQFVSNLDEVEHLLIPQEADTEQITSSVLDDETKKVLKVQKDSFDDKEKQFQQQIQDLTQKFKNHQASTQPLIDTQGEALKELEILYSGLKLDEHNLVQDINQLRLDNKAGETKIQEFLNAGKTSSGSTMKDKVKQKLLERYTLIQNQPNRTNVETKYQVIQVQRLEQSGQNVEAVSQTLEPPNTSKPAKKPVQKKVNTQKVNAKKVSHQQKPSKTRSVIRTKGPPPGSKAGARIKARRRREKSKNANAQKAGKCRLLRCTIF